MNIQVFYSVLLVQIILTICYMTCYKNSHLMYIIIHVNDYFMIKTLKLDYILKYLNKST